LWRERGGGRVFVGKKIKKNKKKRGRRRQEKESFWYSCKTRGRPNGALVHKNIYLGF